MPPKVIQFCFGVRTGQLSLCCCLVLSPFSLGAPLPANEPPRSSRGGRSQSPRCRDERRSGMTIQCIQGDRVGLAQHFRSALLGVLGLFERKPEGTNHLPFRPTLKMVPLKTRTPILLQAERKDKGQRTKAALRLEKQAPPSRNGNILSVSF